MLFSELYGAYYNTVACIINKAISHPIKSTQIEEIIKEYAFSDSSLEISQAIRKQNWKVLRSDGTTPIKNAPTMPLTILEKRWLKAIKNDPRIRLFLDEPSEFVLMMWSHYFCQRMSVCLTDTRTVILMRIRSIKNTFE